MSFPSPQATPEVPMSSAQLRELARSVGFDLCGFSRPEPISPHFLGDWIAQGLCADMDWMGRRMADRLDVKRLLLSARTVISFACNYYRADEGTADSSIAKYARGRDYHYTMRDRLRAFRRGLFALRPESKTYTCTDSGPLMEKVWAVRGGLGYVAKSGCLVTPEYGSYVVLATFMMDAEVDAYADGPTDDRCGRCRICIDACPTGAITLNRRVDARQCLSFHTIENEGSIPESLRPAMKNLTFGCDICQDVCPLNAAPSWGGERFVPREGARMDVRALAGMAAEDFPRISAGTPLARAKYDGMRRNALYALGAMRDVGARELVTRLAEDPVDKVREAARWALEQFDAAKDGRSALG